MVQKRRLEPQREARLTPVMITTMVVGIIIMTIVLMILFATPSLALVMSMVMI